MTNDITQALESMAKALFQLEQRVSELEDNHDKHIQNSEAHKP